MTNSHYIDRNTTRIPLDKAVLSTQIRVFAHALDKRMQFAGIRSIQFDKSHLKPLSDRLKTYRRRYGRGGPDILWAAKILKLYAAAVKDKEFRYPAEKVKKPDKAFINLAESRRSVRKFLKKRVPISMIKKLVAMANLAPSSCNQQSLRYIAVTDKSAKAKIASGGMAGKNAPCVIAVAADMRFYCDDDLNCPEQDAGAAIQTLLLGCHAAGLGACWASAVTVNRPQVRRLLKLKRHEKNIAFVFVGYPESMPIAPDRCRVDEILRFVQ